jgi:hypothetical protein
MLGSHFKNQVDRNRNFGWHLFLDFFENFIYPLITSFLPNCDVIPSFYPPVHISLLTRMFWQPMNHFKGTYPKNHCIFYQSQKLGKNIFLSVEILFFLPLICKICLSAENNIQQFFFWRTTNTKSLRKNSIFVFFLFAKSGSFDFVLFLKD